MIDGGVGLVGIGLVGTALAQRLIDAGYEVYGCDRLADRRQALAAAGGVPLATPAQVAERCARIVFSLPDSNQVRRVLEGTDGLLSIADSPRLIIDTTTGDPAAVEATVAALRQRRGAYLDAAISGSSEQVRSGEAVFMVGGDRTHVDAAADLLAAFGGHVHHVGGVGSGQRAKLASNLILGLHRLVLAEGLLLAEALELDAARFLELVRATPAYSRQMDSKGPRMVKGDFTPPAARLAQHRKDVGLILDSAGRAGLATLPLSELHARLLDAAIEAGDGDLDNSAVLRQLRRLQNDAAPPA